MATATAAAIATVAAVSTIAVATWTARVATIPATWVSSPARISRPAARRIAAIATGGVCTGRPATRRYRVWRSAARRPRWIASCRVRWCTGRVRWLTSRWIRRSWVFWLSAGGCVACVDCRHIVVGEGACPLSPSIRLWLRVDQGRVILRGVGRVNLTRSASWCLAWADCGVDGLCIRVHRWFARNWVDWV